MFIYNFSWNFVACIWIKFQNKLAQITALYEAIQYSNVDVVELLLRRNDIDVNIKNIIHKIFDQNIFIKFQNILIE